MKNYFSPKNILICFMFYTTFLNAQKIEWYKTTGQSGIHVSLFAKDSLGTLFASENNRLLSSIDGGLNWIKVKEFVKNSGESNIIDRIFVEYKEALWIHCVDNLWYYTKDNGSTWDTKNEFFPYVKDINNTRYRVENEIYKSNDQGITWKNISPYPLGYFSSIVIDSNNRIFVGGKYGMFISENGGATWSQNLVGFYVKVLFASANNTIYIFKNNSVLKSIDQGKTWVNLFAADFDEVEEKSSVLSTKEGELLYTRIGDVRYLIYSKDNFSTYTIVKSISVYSEIKSFTFLGNIVLVSYAHPGGIFRSTNFGSTWEILKGDSHSNTEVNSISISGNKIILTTYKEGVIKSTDFGNSWQKIGLENMNLHCSDINTEGEIIIGAYGLIGGIFKAKNDSPFVQVNNGLNTNHTDNITAIKYVTKSTLIASGWWNTENNLYLSSDSGNSWSILPYSGGFYQLVVDKLNRVYCPNRENIIYSDDYGKTWNKTNFNVWRALSMGVNSRNEIFAGTFDGIYKSIDRGNSWVIKLTPPTTFSIDHLFIDSKDNIYAIDATGSLFYSFDDGRSWYSETNLNALCINEDSQHHLVVGTDFGVYRSISSIFTDVDQRNSLPSSFTLSQNYPNPFNPETTIEYSIPVETRHGVSLKQVTLKVYDVLGREVATLVNEYKNAGTYRVTFNVKTRHGASLQSGVYFYRLTSGSYNETKKLVLLK